MSAGHRVSLTFGDTEDEELAYTILQTKGRKKAAYVAQCVKAYEKRRSAVVSDSSLSILKALLEQILAGSHPAKVPSNNFIESKQSQDSTNVSSPRTPEIASLAPDSTETLSFDNDALSQALDALSAFDNF